jgi:hypothetical protein
MNLAATALVVLLSAPPTVRTPVVVPTMPTRPALDLGPVLVLDTASKRTSNERLLVASDELGADGFVIERRALSDVYGDLKKSHGDGPSTLTTVTALLLGAFAGGGVIVSSADAPSATAQSGYYRAFRYVDAPPSAIELPSEIDAQVRTALAGAPDLATQLTRLHALLAGGACDAKTYSAARSALLKRAG